MVCHMTLTSSAPSTTTTKTAPAPCNLTTLLGDLLSLGSMAEDEIHRLTSDDCDEGSCGHDVAGLLAEARVHVQALEEIIAKL